MVHKASERKGQRSLTGTVKLVDIEEEFRRVAGEAGVLGDPTGKPAYCYIRVSSDSQSEDGRSGLPRQILHIHEKALEKALSVPWEMVHADPGFSGFTFENRPALTRLRDEVAKSSRSRYVLIEHLDRLSRNAKWHQGFLLDELQNVGMEVIFWKPFSSEIERVVMGTISEQGMRAEIERMREGYLLKAQRGWVPTKRPAYGFLFADRNGNPKDNSQKETYYALHPEHSKIMRTIFEKVIYEGWTLGQCADWLEVERIPTRFNAAVWCPATLSQLIKNPIYKGELYVNRFTQTPTGKYREDGKPKKVTVQRPAREWLKIEVPAIVTPDEWELAHKKLASNRKRASRNMSRREWLLSGMIHCAVCGYTFVAVRGGTKRSPIHYYGCGSANSHRAKATNEVCHCPYVRADAIESLVWDQVTRVLYDPDLVVSYLEEQYSQGQRESLKKQLAYITSQIEDISRQTVRWREAYLKEVINLEEYEAYRLDLRDKQSSLEQEKTRLTLALSETVDLEEQKRVVLSGLTRLRGQINQEDLPFDLKRKLLSLLVNDIWLDSKTGELRIEGVIRAEASLADTPSELGSSRRSRRDAQAPFGERPSPGSLAACGPAPAARRRAALIPGWAGWLL